MILRSEVPADAIISKGRFVLAMKDEGTDNETWKARFVLQGHCDAMKESLVHEISVARQRTSKRLVGLAAMFCFRIS